jgi:hypothetical protein
VVLKPLQEVQLAVSKKAGSRLDWIRSEVHLAVHGEQEKEMAELRLLKGTDSSVVSSNVHQLLAGVVTNGG